MRNERGGKAYVKTKERPIRDYPWFDLWWRMYGINFKRWLAQPRGDHSMGEMGSNMRKLSGTLFRKAFAEWEKENNRENYPKGMRIFCPG